MLQTFLFLFLALHTTLCVAVNFGNKFWKQKEQNPYVFFCEKGQRGDEKITELCG